MDEATKPKPYPDGLRLVAGGEFLTAGGIKLIREAADEIDRLQVIVSNLSKTADGVTIVLGQTRVFYVCHLGEVLEGIPYAVTIGINLASAPHLRCAWVDGKGKVRGDDQIEAVELYSTREAAETAKENT